MEGGNNYALIAIPYSKKIKRKGYDYVQVLRGKKTCIYSQWYKGNIIAYEVMSIRIRPGRWINELWIEAREKFPGDEDFGYYAWTYCSMEKAREKFNALEDD